MTAAHSRFMLGRMIPTRKTPDLLLGSWELLKQLGRVPRRLIWDNESGIGRGKLTEPSRGVRWDAGDQDRAAPTEGPGIQGRGRAAQRVLRDLVHAGPALRVTGRLQRPVQRLADHRERPDGAHHQGRPVDLLDADKAAMLPLPPAVLHLGWRNHVRLGRDYYVRIDTNDYSVDPRAIGARVDVTADLDIVRVRHGGQLVAEHPRRWARGMTVTDPAHVTAAAALRHAYQHPIPDPRCKTWSATWPTTTKRSVSTPSR